MKKLIAISLVASSLACLAPQAGAVTIGIKGGMNFANVSVVSAAIDLPNFKNQTGIVQGIFVNFNLGPVSIQPELLYSRRGSSWEEYADADVTVTGRVLLDYVEVPILVKYSFLSGPAKPFLYAGASFSSLLEAWNRFDVEFVAETEPDVAQLTEMEDSFKKTELAGVLGAGIDIKVPKVTVSLEGRYHLGLTNLATAVFTADTQITSLKHKGFSVLVGIGF